MFYLLKMLLKSCFVPWKTMCTTILQYQLQIVYYTDGNDIKVNKIEKSHFKSKVICMTICCSSVDICICQLCTLIAVYIMITLFEEQLNDLPKFESQCSWEYPQWDKELRKAKSTRLISIPRRSIESTTFAKRS